MISRQVSEGSAGAEPGLPGLEPRDQDARRMICPSSDRGRAPSAPAAVTRSSDGGSFFAVSIRTENK